MTRGAPADDAAVRGLVRDEGQAREAGADQ